MSWNPHHHPLPEPGDILFGRFPDGDDFTLPGAKPRPCLVLEVRAHSERIQVIVAYGTSQWTHNLNGGEFVVSENDGADFEASGLVKRTKFNLRCVKAFDYSPMFISKTHQHGAPGRMGRITGKLLRKFYSAAQAAELI